MARWYDVDDATSLSWLRDELAGRKPAGLAASGFRAPATRAVLADVGFGRTAFRSVAMVGIALRLAFPPTVPNLSGDV
ncbi:hypothetical protein [Lichenihabitans psoromatis]|uniref:hypothetical protein n=1 Tax=Lichenihabitans psoromatis TaxID=2528642 RepID=UPI001FE0AE60|nr:hypothetical protein [Lichenihabitans psoromatis]